MHPAPAPAPLPSSEQLAAERTDLAVRRTIFAADRSLMAWVRTALSLQSFGFTIYKVLQQLNQQMPESARPHSPRDVGLLLIALGTLGLCMGTLDYLHAYRELQPHGRPFTRPPFLLAVVLCTGGCVLFAAILSRQL